jgi:hypothetical protein
MRGALTPCASLQKSESTQYNSHLLDTTAEEVGREIDS